MRESKVTANIKEIDTSLCRQGDKLMHAVKEESNRQQAAFDEKTSLMLAELEQLRQINEARTQELKKLLAPKLVGEVVADSNKKRISALKKALEKEREEDVLRLAKQLAAEKKKTNNLYLDCANRMRDMIKETGNEAAYAESLKAIFNARTIDDFEFEQFVEVLNKRYPVMQAASLRQQYVRRRRMKQIGKVPDRWLTYSKEAGFLFADLCGVKHVQTQMHRSLVDIAPRADIVVKPMISHDSIGVYLVKALDEILIPKEQIVLKSWDEMLCHAKGLIAQGAIEDSFLVQTLVYGDENKKLIPHDLKFYAFYGEIGCVNEIARDPGMGWWWYTPDGKSIDIGIQNNSLVKPVGFTPEMLKIAEDISKKIPSPFMRIDFLVTEDELFFSEFCSMSGAYFETLIEYASPSYNRSLGNMYLKAEMRLINDLLSGKRFDEINEFNRICDERYGKK